VKNLKSHRASRHETFPSTKLARVGAPPMFHRKQFK
jgi:hypothetical protein